MAIEVRPIEPGEAVDYLKVLPYANGLPHWEPVPAAWYGGPEPWPTPNRPATPEQLEAWAGQVLAERCHPQAAFDGDRIVGASAMISFELTVPGGRQVPMGGVTSTAVIATHRRRGLLRRMMQAMFDEAVERGEPIAGLSASEGTIYGRYGYGPATLRTRWEVDRTQAVFRDAEPDSGRLELTDAATARAAWRTVHDHVRRTRVGELSARPGHWEDLSDSASDTRGPQRHLVHHAAAGGIDGVAVFRIPWSTTVQNAGTLVVEGIQAATPAAYRALWRLLLDFDLTRTIVAAPRPGDEPLRWMLENPRALRVTRQSDSLWLRLLDVPAALEARTYDVPDRIVIGIEADPMRPDNVGRWQLSADPDGASCTRVAATPDVVLELSALGSLYLGGRSAADLAYAGRIKGGAAAVGRLSRLFRTDPEPFNSFVF
ncbi:GNAT family N-acetyltransferase [Microlunatus sp. GCM10028923]|uniref:GNAT family N-acetyltransferase n=1 Tax=Microlunatus sp. GCM10028923 TaxID=3273400 RepID=UPI0036170CC8